MNQKQTIQSIVIGIMIISSVLVLATSTLFVYAQNEVKYKAKLVGTSVVPPVNTTAAGRAVIFVEGHELRWKLNVTGITDPIMAHIHMGKKGMNGSIIADLLQTAKIEGKPDRTIITGTITAADLQDSMDGKTLQDLKSAFNNATTNIDLHTRNFPNGELRGTIRLQGDGTNASAIAFADTNATTIESSED